MTATSSMRLRFEVGEAVPTAHSTVYMWSPLSQTTYRVRIHRIRQRIQHPDGATLLDVRATRTVAREGKRKEGEADRTHNLHQHGEVASTSLWSGQQLK